MLRQERFHTSGLDLRQLSDQVQRIVVLQTDQVGDLLNTMPLVRTLRQSLPRAEITMVIKPANRELIEHWDAVDRLLYCYPDSDTEHKKELERELRNGCDLAIMVRPRLRECRLLSLTGAKYKVGFVNWEISLVSIVSWFSLNQFCACNRHRPTRHIVEHTTDLAHLLGLEMSNPRLELPLTAAAKDFASTMFSAWGNPDVVVHLNKRWFSPGLAPRDNPHMDMSNHPAWEMKDLAQLINQLLELPTVQRLVVTYGPEEANSGMVQKLTKALRRSNIEMSLLNFSEAKIQLHTQVAIIGDLSLQQWAAILATARLTVTCDTGAAHLATAVQCPVIDVFPPNLRHIQWNMWYPWRGCGATIVRGTFANTSKLILEKAQKLLCGASAYTAEEMNCAKVLFP